MTTGPEFKAMLDGAGLRQVEFGRLVQVLAGEPGPDANHVSRWCRGVRPVPAWAVALLRLYDLMPARAKDHLRAAIADMARRK